MSRQDASRLADFVADVVENELSPLAAAVEALIGPAGNR